VIINHPSGWYFLENEPLSTDEHSVPKNVAPSQQHEIFMTALGFSPLADQQLSGLMMWVPGGTAYLPGGLAVASRWLLRSAGAEPLPGAMRAGRVP
jgi:hypothetical protein